MLDPLVVGVSGRSLLADWTADELEDRRRQEWKKKEKRKKKKKTDETWKEDRTTDNASMRGHNVQDSKRQALAPIDVAHHV